MSITKSDLECMLFDKAVEPKALPLSLMVEITNGFSDKLEIGRGGFAVVYKAHLYSEDIAVKRLSNTYMYEEEFHREVECLMKARNKNIIRFLGYCSDTQGNMARYNGKLVMADTQQRLLCFEYLPNGSLDGYIKDASGGLEWRLRYRIIRGMCEGLLHLHQINILHLDLKPSNILLDREMTPKITDFGLSRCIEEDQTRIVAQTVSGTRGYLAPEFTSGVITDKFDLYSLGVIMLEILTGQKGCATVENVLQSWGKRLEISQGNPQWEQIRICTEIGIECTNIDPEKRPVSMKHIMDRLVEADDMEVIELLDVRPSVLRFPFEPNKVISSSLHLENNMNEHVVFRLMDKSKKNESCFIRLPLYGLVPPRSTYTVIVTTVERNEIPQRRNICMILESRILGCEDIQTFQSQSKETLFEGGKEMGSKVQEMKLISAYTLRQEIMSSEILDMGKWYKRRLHSLDTNQCKQWIITGGSRGHVGIWDYQTQATVACVKFIARKQWFVAATEGGGVHVYTYGPKIQKITSLSVGPNYGDVVLLAVHPSQPYLLAACGDIMKLWDWDKGWECIQTFKRVSYPRQVVFTPNNAIASPYGIKEIEVLSIIGSPTPRCTLSGHSDKVNCMDFLTCGDQEYLVSGSDDKTSKIWDMENKICVYTLEAFQSPVISVVCQPNLQMIIAGSKDGLIYLWSTANSRISSRSPRLERIINVGYGGALSSLACLMGRVVIAKEDAVAVTILDLENANYQEGSTDYNEAQSTVYPRPGNITSKVMVAGSSELLDVYPLELHFHGEVESEDHNMRSLHLTNNTDEHVAFRVTNKSGESRWYPCFIKLPLYGTVPPGSTCRLIVAIAQDWENEEMDFDLDLVLESSISGDKHIAILEERGNCDEFFSESKELGHTVHEVAMKFVYTPTTQGEATFEPEISPRIKIISMKKFPGDLSCLHAHPTEPWIITGHWDGDVGIWNSETQELVHTFKVSEKIVMCVKFNAREQWIVAQTNDTLIHVYDCVRITQIKKVASLGAPVDNYLSYYSISMHPSKPYVLSTTMKLWEGDKGWECTRAFGHRSICQAFDPEDPNSFASGTYSPDVQVWSIDSSELNHSMSGHSESAVKCLAYFTRGDRQYLITGSEDCTAKIWDLQKKTCIHTLEGFMSPVTHVISLPGRPYLVTCSSRGTIHVWSSTDFRLKTTVNFGGEYVFGLACLMGSRRIAIGARYNVSIMDIDDEEAVGTEGQN